MSENAYSAEEMDAHSDVNELLEKWSTVCSVSAKSLRDDSHDDDAGSTDTDSKRFALFKNRGALVLNQEKRRKELLEAQKKKREDVQMLARHIALDEEALTEESTQVNYRVPWHQRKKAPNKFKDQLMFSEWMLDIPFDFEAKWLSVLCPVGKRTLIVASKGETKAFTAGGRLVESFSSLLPGGSRHSQRSEFTLLDCIFNESLYAFYVLDVMCWKSSPFFDCDTECRFFWLASKLSEVPELCLQSQENDYAFNPVSFCRCNKEAMQELMRHDVIRSVELDGVLFYHGDAHYTAGRTPLVGWLKPFMLPEVLGVPVPEEMMRGHENESAQDFVQDFDAKQAEKRTGRGRRRGSSAAMETVGDAAAVKSVDVETVPVS